LQLLLQNISVHEFQQHSLPIKSIQNDANGMQGKIGHQQLLSGHLAQKQSHLCRSFLIEKALKPDRVYTDSWGKISQQQVTKAKIHL